MGRATLDLRLAFPVALAIVAAACSDGAEVSRPSTETDDTLTAIVSNTQDTSALASALERTGLAGALEGPGSYTVLAPGNESFRPLAAGSGDESDKAVVAAILREHILPGQLEIDAISDAIDANGGSISVATVGNGNVEFAKDGDTITAKLASGEQTAKLTGAEKQGRNGGILMIDRPLQLPPEN